MNSEPFSASFPEEGLPAGPGAPGLVQNLAWFYRPIQFIEHNVGQ